MKLKYIINNTLYFIFYTLLAFALIMIILTTLLSYFPNNSIIFTLGIIAVLFTPYIAYKTIELKNNKNTNLPTTKNNESTDFNINYDQIEPDNFLNSLSEKERFMVKNIDTLLLENYLYFEHSTSIEEAGLYLIKINNLLKLYQFLEIYNLPRPPIPFNDNQNAIKIPITYPDIVHLVSNALYVIENFDYLSALIKTPIKQVDLVKIIEKERKDLNIHLIKEGLYFLGKYNLIQRWNMKNRVWFHYNK